MASSDTLFVLPAKPMPVEVRQAPLAEPFVVVRGYWKNGYWSCFVCRDEADARSKALDMVDKGWRWITLWQIPADTELKP